jgi:hypothetical protein
MVTHVLDGTDSDASCLRGESAGLGMDRDFAAVVDYLTPAVMNARVREANIVRVMR